MTVFSRKTAPTARTTWDQTMPFRVWTYYLNYDEDPKPWKCVAAFMFLGDCLDYIADLQDRGVDSVFQSPAETRPILATDQRVVYKPVPAALVEPARNAEALAAS